jgi:hypothetical protein
MNIKQWFCFHSINENNIIGKYYTLEYKMADIFTIRELSEWIFKGYKVIQCSKCKKEIRKFVIDFKCTDYKNALGYIELFYIYGYEYYNEWVLSRK